MSHTRTDRVLLQRSARDHAGALTQGAGELMGISSRQWGPHRSALQVNRGHVKTSVKLCGKSGFSLKHTRLSNVMLWNEPVSFSGGFRRIILHHAAQRGFLYSQCISVQMQHCGAPVVSHALSYFGKMLLFVISYVSVVMLMNDVMLSFTNHIRSQNAHVMNMNEY